MEIQYREANKSQAKHAASRDSRIKKKQFLRVYSDVSFLGAVDGIELNLVDRFTYSYLLDNAPFYIQQRGYYAPAIETIAYAVGVSHSQMKRVMKRLIECGLVRVLNSKTGCTNELGIVKLDGSVISPSKDIDERIKEATKQSNKTQEEIDNDFDESLPW